MNCLAASYSESKELVFIATSPTKEDFEVFRDCRREFFDSLEKTLNLGAKYDKNYIIITPFIHMTKGEVIREGQRLNVPFENTWTCYEGKETPCMTCPSCQVRIQGFKDAGIIDPLVK
jgi:7-cyano-7-deazaguanine synthase